jgi:hypothetical protein
MAVVQGHVHMCQVSRIGACLVWGPTWMGRGLRPGGWGEREAKGTIRRLVTTQSGNKGRCGSRSAARAGLWDAAWPGGRCGGCVAA